MGGGLLGILGWGRTPLRSLSRSYAPDGGESGRCALGEEGAGNGDGTVSNLDTCLSHPLICGWPVQGSGKQAKEILPEGGGGKSGQTDGGANGSDPNTNPNHQTMLFREHFAPEYIFIFFGHTYERLQNSGSVAPRGRVGEQI